MWGRLWKTEEGLMETKKLLHPCITGTECMDGGAGKGLPFTYYYIPDFLTHWVWGLLFCYHREIKLRMLI